MKMEHSPLPWVADEDRIYDGLRKLVTIISGDGGFEADEANAAKIVEAVNGENK